MGHLSVERFNLHYVPCHRESKQPNVETKRNLLENFWYLLQREFDYSIYSSGSSGDPGYIASMGSR